MEKLEITEEARKEALLTKAKLISDAHLKMHEPNYSYKDEYINLLEEQLEKEIQLKINWNKAVQRK